MKLNQIKMVSAHFSRLRRSVFSSSFLTIAFLASMLFVASCAESSSEKADRVGGVTAQQIIENPSAYVGKTVTVSGDVEEIHDPRAFNMDSGTSLGELLVVGREPFPQIPGNESRAYLINDVATITGVIKLFNADEVKKDIGWDLTPNLVTAFNGKPVLIVTKAEFRAGKGGTAPVANTQMNQPMTNANNVQPMTNANNAQSMTNTAGNMPTGDALTDIGVYALTADKLSLASKAAQFSDARVVRVVGPRTFTIASGKEEIYVMLDDASARGVGTQGKINKGDTVSVAGTFERLQMDEINDIENRNFVDLTPTERDFLKKTKLFLQANTVSGSK